MIFWVVTLSMLFLDSVYEVYRPLKEHKFQGYVEIINQQKGEVILEDKWVWLTNSFTSKHFDDFVRGEIRDEIAKRIIVNGQSGSSWHFKRFEWVSVILVLLTESKKLILSKKNVFYIGLLWWNWVWKYWN